MTAGLRDKLIRFQRFGTTENEYGEPIPNPVPEELGQEWARVIYGDGREQRQAAMEGGELPATFLVLDNSMTRAVKITDRISFDEGAWDITSNKPANTPGERAINATRST